MKWSRIGATHADLIIKMYKTIEIEDMRRELEYLKVMIQNGKT